MEFVFAENVTVEGRTSVDSAEENSAHSQSQQQQTPSSQTNSSGSAQSQQQSQNRSEQQQKQQQSNQYRETPVGRAPQPPATPEKPGWGYSGLDLIGTQASAFWQNYQGI